MDERSVLVLVVDDDDDIRECVADLLALEGYRVATARNGVEALALLERTRAGLIILDMRMPHMNGWQLAHELRARGWILPLLVMTAAADAGAWAAEIQADACVPKPFELEELLDTVNRIAAAPQPSAA